MKIICIAADLNHGHLGGAEIHCVEVIKRLSTQHQVHLFVGADTQIAQEFNNQVKVYRVNYPRIPNLAGIAYIIFGFFQIRRQLKTFEFDLIWAKQCFPQAPLASLLKKIYGKPLYITAQNPHLLFEELTVTGLPKSLHHFWAKLLQPLVIWSIRQADLLAAVSQYSANLARKMNAKKVIVIPNGIDQRLLLSGKSAAWKNQLKILTTSSLIPRNGIDTLIHSVAMLPSTISWHLTIAGDGPERENLHKLCRDLAISDRVDFLGRVANVQIPTLLSQANLFIRASRWEGFGVSFLEAMAAKIPVIATPVGGIPDFITHLETGLLVHPDNPKQLAEAIKQIHADKNLRETIIQNAHYLVQKKYNWDVISQSVESAMINLTINKIS